MGRSTKGICVNCGELGTIKFVPPPRLLLNWCTKCRTPKNEAAQALLQERNKVLLALPGLSANESIILMARSNGLRIAYIAERIGLPREEAEQIEANVLAAALN